MNSDPPHLDYAPEPDRRSSWPVTFGVIAIVFGFFGALGAAYGIFGALMMSQMGKNPEFTSALDSSDAIDEEAQRMMTGMFENMELWAGIQVILGVGLVALAILLLVSGILLLNRKPISAKLLNVWAYGKIVIGIGSALIGYQLQQGVMQEAMQSTASSGGGGLPTSMDSMISAFTIAVFFIGVLWTCVLPVVFLIWLNRGVVKADIASWGNSAAPSEDFPDPAI